MGRTLLNYCCPLWPIFLKVPIHYGYLLRVRSHRSAVVEAIDPFKILPHQLQSSYAVDALMNESLSHYCCAYWPSFRSLPLNSDCLQRGKPQHCLAVEDRPIQNGFHINIKHIQGVGCEYGRVFTLLPPFIGQAFESKYHLDLWLSPKGQSTSQCGGWGYRPIQDGFQYPTHIRCFTTFICCGCAYGCVLSTYM